MIRNKMEMATLIRSLNELEKLKLLLFDDNQLYLFEHIPKPFLIDPKLTKDEENDNNSESELSEEEHPKNDEEIGANFMKKLEQNSMKKKEEEEEKIKNMKKKKRPKKKRKTHDILLSSNKGFWNKEIMTGEDALDKFNKSIDSIREKEQMNIIDERLFQALRIPLPEKDKKKK